MRRIWLRVAALVLATAGAIAGLTVYFSTENVPPCYLSGAHDWRPPADRERHRFAVVFPDRAACFFTIGGEPRLAGQLELPGAHGITAAVPNGSKIALRTPSGPYTLDPRSGRLSRGALAPFASGYVAQPDPGRHVMYVTQRGLLGFRVIDMRTGLTRYVIHFKGFTWNPRFGPNPPSHGLALAPDRPELWVLDAPNHALHVFDVSELPDQPPRRLADVRLDRTMTHSGSLLQSADGRFLFVGSAGDVIDTRTREPVAHLDALQHASAALEVDIRDGQPVFPGFPR